jgi:hypothetical protein
MVPPRPIVPEQLHPLAGEILEGLRSRPEARAIVLGGGVALKHYCDYRDTVDLDAWWEGQPQSDTEALIHETMARVAKRHGWDLGLRAWGDTKSYELRQGGKKVFSFQISRRTLELDSPEESAWAPVRIETFRDNLGAKMNALVERGAPRDFLDVQAVSSRGLATPATCWSLWSLKNPGRSVREARLRVLHLLQLIEARRPLDSIADPNDRAAARLLRTWVREAFCKEGVEP